jgi:predicted phage-related endonuclease
MATKTKAVKDVELSETAKVALANFNKAKQAEAKAKELKAKAELELREALGSAVQGTIDGVVVIKVVSGTNSHFDRRELLERYPDAYYATYQETPYTYLKTL